MQRSVIFALSAVALGALVPIACTQNFGTFDATAGSSSGVGGSASGGGGSASSLAGSPTSSSSSSSGSGATACKDSTQCSDDNPCTKDLCDLKTGDCSHDNLDGAQPGIEDNNACTADVCVDGVPKHPGADPGTKCGSTNKLFCDGKGNCVGCLSEQQCTPATDCAQPTCTAGTCGVQNKPKGSTCATGKCNGEGACVPCLIDTDCPGDNSACNNNLCIDRCTDKTQNGEETDVDCGGSQCAGCAPGKICVDDPDCATGTCDNGICTDACANGTKDGAETDVDCGGGVCPKCANGKVCSGNTDCESGACKGKVCSP